MKYQEIDRRINPFLGIFFIFFLLGFLLYLNTFNSPFFYDDHHVVENISVADAFKRCLNPKRAIAHLSFALNIYLGGQHVTSYHIINTLIHILTSYGVFLLLYLLLKSRHTHLPERVESNDLLSAFWSAIIFLVHPLATQSVTYICQRYTSLATFFYIMALVYFVYAREIYRRKNRFASFTHFVGYGFSLLFAILAMFTKEFPVSLPAIVLLVEFCFLPNDFLNIYRRIGYLLPHLFTGLIIPILYTSNNFFTWLTFGTERVLTVSEDVLPNWAPEIVSRSSYFYTQIDIAWNVYFKLMFLPWGQSFDHLVHIHDFLLEKEVLIPFGYLTFVIILACISYKRFRYFSFGIFWFFITLAPTSSIIPNKQFAAEHRMYLPLVCLSFLLVEIANRLIKKHAHFILFLPIATLLAVLTISRNFVWKDSFSIWYDASRKAPNQDRPHLALGDLYLKKKKYHLAEGEYRKFLLLNQKYSGGYIRLGQTLKSQGRPEEAIKEYLKARNVNKRNYMIYPNLVAAYKELNSYKLAIIAQKELMKLIPDRSENHYVLGELYESDGNLVGAVSEYQKAVLLRPDFVHGYIKLGNVYMESNEWNSADRILREALMVCNSMEALIIRTHLGQLYEKIGKYKEAITEYLSLLKARPKSANLHFLLAQSFFKSQEYAKSIIYCDKAIELGMEIDPEFLTQLKPFRERHPK